MRRNLPVAPLPLIALLVVREQGDADAESGELGAADGLEAAVL